MSRSPAALGAVERVLLALVFAALWLLIRTLRVRIEGEERLRERLANGERVVLVSWHGRLLLALRPMLPYRPVVMISESRDGARIAWLAERFGCGTVRGSSSHGGIRALLRMIREVAGGRLGGHLVDGPRGPAGEVKPGVILLASRARAVIVPLYLTGRPRWVASSWDRFYVPLPFAKVEGSYGEPMAVPADLTEGEAEALRRDLEKRMTESYRALETS